MEQTSSPAVSDAPNPMNPIDPAQVTGIPNPSSVMDQAAATGLNPISMLEQGAGNYLNPAKLIEDILRQAVTSFLSQLFPPSLRTIIQNPLSLSSYTPLLQNLLHWIGRNPYQLLFAVATGQLILVAVVAVAAFILFFFTATSAAVVIILSGIVFVSASTASTAIAIVTCSF